MAAHTSFFCLRYLGCFYMFPIANNASLIYSCKIISVDDLGMELVGDKVYALSTWLGTGLLQWPFCSIY